MRPLTLTDYTEVVAVEPPRRIELKAKARPLGTADIVITLRELADGTEVRMIEEPGDALTRLVTGNPVADAVLRIRNAEALARLSAWSRTGRWARRGAGASSTASAS